ncbi:MAG: hypothetical protein IMF19_13115 [Proteobacteria bacterium]|jgi:hypothetical protein|nr:hypothetical protein [Pseudomonadota bacterium]
MGRGLTAVFTGITTLCTIFTFKELGSSPLLAIPIEFELCSLFFSTLGLALYPIMIKSAVSIYSSANELNKDISKEFSKILQKYNPAITEGVINDILEEKKIVEQIIEGRGKGAGFWVYFLILIYYYAFSFALIGIAFLIVIFGIIVF